MNAKMMGQIIRMRRKAKGITQEGLAEMLKVSAAFVGHIERGTRMLSVETLCAICQTLEFSADELLGLGKRKEQNDRAKAILMHLEEIKKLL